MASSRSTLLQEMPAKTALGPYRRRERLGRELSCHRVRRFELLRWVLFFVASLLLGLALFLPLVLGDGVDLRDAFVAFLFAPVCLGISVYCFRRFVRARRARLVIREAGFSFSDGESVREVGWDDVTGVWAAFDELVQGNAPQTIACISVKGSRGLLFPKHLEGARIFAAQVQASTEARLRLEAEEAVSDGQTVDFGPVAVSQRFLAVDDKYRFHWENIVGVRLSFNKLEVRYADGGHVLYPTEGVRNLNALCALSAKLASGRGRIG